MSFNKLFGLSAGRGRDINWPCHVITETRSVTRITAIDRWSVSVAGLWLDSGAYRRAAGALHAYTATAYALQPLRLMYLPFFSRFFTSPPHSCQNQSAREGARFMILSFLSPPPPPHTLTLSYSLTPLHFFNSEGTSEVYQRSCCFSPLHSTPSPPMHFQSRPALQSTTG